MRILFLSNFYPPARSYGYTQWCYEVAQGLQQRGHATAILTSRYRREAAPADEQGIYRLLHLETSALDYYRPFDFFRHFRRWERENRFALDAAMDDFSPDVLFVWGMWNLSRGILEYAERRDRPPAVYYISDLWPAGPDTHAAYWQSPARHLLARPLKCLLRQMAWRMLAQEGWPHRLRFDHAICVSHYIKETLTASGLPLKDVAVIHGGTDVERFQPNPGQAHTDGRSLRLLYAGQLAEHKGVATAVEALARLADGYPELRLTLVGSGHPDYEAHLLTLAQMAGLQDRVVFRGPVPREQMPQVLAEHDVLIFPSTGPEALPRMVQEGMAAGLVVVGTTTGGTGEILVDGENGLTFAPEDAQGLARQIERLVHDPALRERLAAAGRRTVQEKFTLEKMVNEIESYLLGVLREASTHGPDCARMTP